MVAEKEGEDSTVEGKTDSAVDEEEKKENLVGAAGERVVVGDNVTAEFDSETGTVTFYSHGGTLSGEWESILNNISGFNKLNSVIKITISADSDVMYLPEDCSHLVVGFESLQSLDFSKADTSNVTNMERMFSGCSNLQTLDVSGFDTSNVTDMSEMFYMCNSVQTLDVSGFDTSNVTDMSLMFRDCNSLEALDVSGFDTSSVVNMSGMFCNCYSLQTLDVNGFDTLNVTDMSLMFQDCSSLQSLDVSGFDTSNVTSMISMFCYCSNLQTLDLNGFDTSNVTSMSWMFCCCINLQTLDVSGFNTSNVTNMTHMFRDCINLQTLDLSGFDMSNLTDNDPLFADNSTMLNGCDLLDIILTPVNVQTTINIPYRYVDDSGTVYESLPEGLSESIRLTRKKIQVDDRIPVGESVSAGFDSETGTLTFYSQGGTLSEDWKNLLLVKESGIDGYAIKKITISDDSDKMYLPTDCKYLFQNLNTVQSIDLSKSDTSNVTNMSYMFSGCEDNLQILDLSGFNTSNVTNMSYMFEDCDSIQTLDISGFDTSNVVDMSGMFEMCENLQTLDLSGFDTSSVVDMSGMFYSCSNLQALDLSGFDTSNVTDMSRMFVFCYGLQTLDLSGFETSNVTNMYQMFFSCLKLQNLDLSGFDTSSVKTMGRMFLQCNNLRTLDLSGFDMSKVMDTEYMFVGCDFIDILTPVNVHITINLPEVYVDAAGTEYNSLPEGLSDSIRLTKKDAEVSADIEVLSLSDDYYGANGKPASFHIEAQGQGTVTYQWQYRTTGMTDWKSPSQESAQTADYSFKLKPSYDNIEVRCIVSDESGNEIISETRKANVFAYTAQPRDAAASEGQVVNFEVSAIGRGVTYQWYYMRPNGAWRKTTVSGSNTAILPITAGTKNDGTSYRCVITDEEGNKITSAAGTLTLEIPLQITGISEDAYDVNGESVTFHVDALGKGDLSYQWQYKLDGETNWRTPGQASAKTADYIFKLRPSYDNIEVRCIVQDASGNSVTSDVRKANVFAIKGQPQDAQLEMGEKTTFAVEAVGRELVYQWYYMRPEGSWKKVTVAGYNTAALVITANNKNDGTMFRCLVKDVLGNTLTSRAATLTQ